MSNSESKQVTLPYAENSVGDVSVLVNDEVVWIDRKSLAKIFGIDKTGIGRHIRNIFDSGELV